MKLHPNAVFYFMFQSMVFWLVFSFFLVFFFMFGEKSGTVIVPCVFCMFAAGFLFRFLCIFIVLNFFNWLYCYLLVQSYRIELADGGILLDSGILNKKHETLLYNKIQSILINRNILERLLGLSTIVIQNAMGNPEIIPGFDASVADTFKNDILSRVK